MMAFYFLPLTFTIDAVTLGYVHIKDMMTKSYNRIRPDTPTDQDVYDYIKDEWVEGTGIKPDMSDYTKPGWVPKGGISGLWDDFGKLKNPEVSVLISSHNEIKKINNTLVNLEKQSYPVKNVIFSDSNLDKSEYLVNYLSKSFPSLNIIYWSMDNVTSKADKINHIVDDSNIDLGDLVYFMDIGLDLEPDTIKQLVDAFSKEDIAAVTSYGIVTPTDSYNSNMYHYGKEWVNRMGKFRKNAQKHRNAIPVLCGASFMVKTDVLEDHDIPTDTKTEDTGYTWLLLRNGYKIGFEPDSFVSTGDVKSLKAQLKQSWRWYSGTWQNLYRQKDIFSPKSKARSLAYTTIAPSLIESVLYTGTVLSLPLLAYYEPELAQGFLIGDTVLSFMAPVAAPLLSGDSKTIVKELYKTLRYYPQITAYKVMSSALWLGSGAKVGLDVIKKNTDKWSNTW